VKVLDRSEADSVLEGVIKSFYFTSVSYDQSGFVSQYQTYVLLDLTLRKRTGEVLWVVKDFSETNTYRASSSGLVSQASQDAAIQQLGRFVAQRLRTRFFYDF
jgi:hypothetical protein